jgi:hypothetical protein
MMPAPMTLILAKRIAWNAPAYSETEIAAATAFLLAQLQTTAGFMASAEDEPQRDPRDPDPSRAGIFRDHNCWKCRNGAHPCVAGNPLRCEYPRARNE